MTDVTSPADALRRPPQPRAGARRGRGRVLRDGPARADRGGRRGAPASASAPCAGTSPPSRRSSRRCSRRCTSRCCSDARAALEQPDPGAAFHTFFFALSEFQARHRALAEHMATEIDLPASAQSVRDALRGAIDELVDARAGRGRDPRRHRSGRRRAALLRRRARDRARRRPPARAAPALRRADPRRPPPARGEPRCPGKPLDFAQLRKLKNKNAKSKPQ